MNQVDVVAVLPWYLELAVSGGGSGLAVLRAIRLVRVFRVFKLGRYNTSAMIFKRALERSAQPLSLLFYFMLIANIFVRVAVYYAEAMGANANPSDVDNFDDPLPAFPFDSIPRAMYWCMVTMTTVGYGDMYPITLIGRIVAVITMLSGIVVLAMPITLIGSNFVEEYRKSQANELKEKRRKESRRQGDRGDSKGGDAARDAQRPGFEQGAPTAGAGKPGAVSRRWRRFAAHGERATAAASGRVAGDDVLSPGERIVEHHRPARGTGAAAEDSGGGRGCGARGSAPWDTQVTPPPRGRRGTATGPAAAAGGGAGGLDNDAAERLREMEQRLARMEAMLTRIMNRLTRV